MGLPAAGPPLQFPILEVITKERERERERESIYLNSKGRHEASDVELLIVQPLKKPLGIGN